MSARRSGGQVDRTAEMAEKRQRTSAPEPDEESFRARIYIKLVGTLHASSISKSPGAGAQGQDELRTVEDLIKAAQKEFPDELGCSNVQNINVYCEDLNSPSSNQQDPLQVDSLLDQLPKVNGNVRVGASASNPLFIYSLGVHMCPGSPLKATFKFCELKANAPPFTSRDVDLQDGRIHVNSVLNLLGSSAKALMRIEGPVVDFISTIEEGLSDAQFEANETYFLYVERATSRNINISYSDQNLSMRTVCADFGIKFHMQQWDLSKLLEERWPQESMPCPSETLLDFIDQTKRLRVQRSEGSWSNVVNNFLLSALDKVAASPQQSLRLADNSHLSFKVPRKDLNDHITMAQYNGFADFVVGHSPEGNKILQDTSLLVVEVKTAEMLSKAQPQALAQAAVCLNVRWMKRRGENHTGGPVYFARTDGMTWIFSKLHKTDEGLQVTEASPCTWLSEGSPSRGAGGSLKKLFGMLVYILEESQRSSPRVSAT